jgi:hypothetical protein
MPNSGRPVGRPELLLSCSLFFEIYLKIIASMQLMKYIYYHRKIGEYSNILINDSPTTTTTTKQKVDLSCVALMCCSSVHLKVADAPSREDASTSWPSSSGLRGRTGTYLTILKLADSPWADYALFKMVRYVLLRPLRPELDGQDVKKCGKTPSLHVLAV